MARRPRKTTKKAAAKAAAKAKSGLTAKQSIAKKAISKKADIKKPATQKTFSTKVGAKAKTGGQETVKDSAATQIKGGLGDMFTGAPGAGRMIDLKIPDARLDLDLKPKEPFDFLSKTAPLSLFPLSLEYRFVTRDAAVELRDTGDLRGAIAKTQIRSRSQKARQAEIAAREKVVAGFEGKSTSFTNAKLKSVEELWVRWYPEENFAEQGVAPPTPEETAAKTAFQAAIGGRDWWDLSDAGVSAEWQNFARAVGPFRAVHLMRGGEGDGDYPERIGRIAALPRKVELFASEDNKLTKLGEGAPIPPNSSSVTSAVAYTPAAADPGGWLVDFEAAVGVGMGMKLTDPEAIRAAKAADWIIAVGLAGSTGQGDVQALIGGHIANGAFAVLPQDAPTNNTPDAPSHLARPEGDLTAFTPRASALERGAHSPGDAADLLAEAFDLPPDALRRAVDSADTGFEDARAMLRVIGPALLDAALDGASRIDGVTENEFIDIMAAAIAARGALPAVRFGDAAMGILPISKISDLEPPGGGADTAEGKVNDFLKLFATFSRALLPVVADRRVPVIEPGDPDAPDKLFDILGVTRVSKRIDVVETGANGGDPRALGCAYVDGASRRAKPAQYLRALRTDRIATLPDPDSRNREWPLLYRLGRLSLAFNTEEIALKHVGRKIGLSRDDAKIEDAPQGKAVKEAFGERSVSAIGSGVGGGVAFGGLSKIEMREITRVNAAFADALAHLEGIAARPDGAAQLEVLLCEVIDLFQHRVDAFATGLAYARLKADRAAGQTGLRTGYYGFLGKLRPASVTGGGDGYIQAPSMPQAVTSALLRSAYLRHRGDGAFQINLGSRRVRGALKLLDLIAKGHSLNECLGLRGERWLHDRRLDTQIIGLRSRYPIASERGEAIASRRVFDGMAFVADNHGADILRQLKAQLNDDLDALADVVMAEAAHQRTLGRGGAASAWLRVLSGHPPPGQPAFLKTQRHGQASSHRASLMVEAASPSPGDNPREIAEPALAALARRVMPEFAAAGLSAQVAGGGPSAVLSLGGDLGLAPLDLAIGGVSEIELRAQRAVLRQLSADPQNAPGAVRVELTAANAALTRTMAAAEALRRSVQTGRALEASDLNASASIAAGDLDEAGGVAALEFAISDLRGRITALSARMGAALAAVATPLTRYDTAIAEAGRRRDAGADAAAITASLAGAEAHRAALGDALADLAAYGAPEALRPVDAQATLADPLGRIGALRDLVAAVENRRRALGEALSAHPATGHASLSSARAALQACAAALQGALDGEALPILPPTPRTNLRLRPSVGAPAPVGATLGRWVEERPDLRLLSDLAAAAPDLAAFATRSDATENPADPNADQRGQAEAPAVRHNGVFVAAPELIASNTPVAGLVIDEWAITRPSQTQMAGIAINYDSPQSEPPHCIILGVAPNASYKTWTSLRAADLVQETIAWTKVRALSSHDRITPGALFPNANIVNRAKVDGESRARIPTRSIFDLLADVRSAGLNVTVADALDDKRMLKAQDFPERPGFGRVKE